MIRVVNKYKLDREGAVSVMRPSPLGNPYKIKSAGGPYEREETIPLYEAHLRQKLAEGDPAIRAAMNDLYLKAVEGDLDLMCVCAPRACHADVIKKVLDEVLS